MAKSIDRTLLEGEQPVLDRMLQNTTVYAPAEQFMSFHIGIDIKNTLQDQRTRLKQRPDRTMDPNDAFKTILDRQVADDEIQATMVELVRIFINTT